jgi:hypothetical protein
LRDVAVLVGSEAARGVPKLRTARPTFTAHSSEEFASVIDGSYFQGDRYDVMLAYGQVKYLGARWMGAMARMHPALRFIVLALELLQPLHIAGLPAELGTPAAVGRFGRSSARRLQTPSSNVGLS